MKAIVVKKFGGPEVLEVDTVPIPEPGDAHVLVKVMSSGVNPVDTYRRAGAYPALPQLPWIPGTDAAGTVHKVGPGVTRFKVGDRVWVSAGNGTYAQYCLAPETGIHILPANISFDQGASLWVPYATAYHSLVHAAGAKQGDSVLIHGASGGVGLACLQYAKHLKMNTLGTASTENGFDLIRKEGATPFNHKEDGYIQKISQHAQPNGGLNVIIEMLANVNLAKDLSLIGPKGCIVIVGNRGTIEINPRDIMRTRCRVTGVALLNATKEELAECVESIDKGIRAGYLNPTVGQLFSLQNSPQAHHHIINPPQGASGKVLIRPWD